MRGCSRGRVLDLVECQGGIGWRAVGRGGRTRRGLRLAVWQRHQCKEQEQEESLGAPPHGRT